MKQEMIKGMLKISFKSLIFSLGFLSHTHVFAGEVEVLHFWTSGGEAKSVAELKALLTLRGHTWKDFAVVGGGGENAMSVLKQRVIAGQPPAAATIMGPAVQEWAASKALTNLDAMAQYDKWDESLPKVIADHMKFKGNYVAVPVNVHRVNWLWSNSAVLKKAGVHALPTNYEEFFEAAEKIKAIGITPIAHGGQAWQNFTLFESVALGIGGVEFYKNAFIKLKPAALSSKEMKKSLEVFRRMKRYTDEKSPGRDWNTATDMVIQGKAGFQFMGDWAKGEFFVAGQQPGREFNCTPAPGTAQTFTYVINTFAMFQLKSREAQKAQGYLAYLLMTESFQETFNLRKGSIPARLNVNMERFDACGKEASNDFKATEKLGTLLPSAAIEMAISPKTHAVFRAAISEYWSVDKTSANSTIAKLLLAAKQKQASFLHSFEL
jgi:glucose/mannose transport system substrate-binding protein